LAVGNGFRSSHIQDSRGPQGFLTDLEFEPASSVSGESAGSSKVAAHVAHIDLLPKARYDLIARIPERPA
jgi:hypothetical protein